MSCRRMLLALALAVTMPVPADGQPQPLLTKVEHFYLVSDDAEWLFDLFRDDLELPQVWPFQSYGDFGSGAVSLSNTVMEFVTEKTAGGATGQARFTGIAFEPVRDADAAVAELDRRRVQHEEPEPYTYTQDGQQRIGWVTVTLKGVPPANAYVFICDYKQREQVEAGRSRASVALAAKGGGPLGVVSLEEIVLAVESVEAASRDWDRLLESPAGGQGNLLAFGPGPRLRLVRADVEGIQSIVVRVKSVANARRFLVERRMLGATEPGRQWIDPAAIRGLQIALVED